MITKESYESSRIGFDFDKILLFKKCWMKFKQRHRSLHAPTDLLLELSKEMGFACPTNFNFLNYKVVWCQKLLGEYFKISHSINKVDLIAINQSIINKRPLVTYEADSHFKALFNLTPLPLEIIGIISSYANPNLDLNSQFNELIYNHVNCKMHPKDWNTLLFNVNKLNRIFIDILKRMDFYLPIIEIESSDPDSILLSQFFNIRSFFKSIFCDSELSYKILHYFYVEVEKINEKIWMCDEEEYFYIKIFNFFIEPLISNLSDKQLVFLTHQILCKETDCSFDFYSHQLKMNVNGLGLLKVTFLPLRKFTSDHLIEYLSILFYHNQNQKCYHWEKLSRIKTTFGAERGLYELFLVKITEDLSLKELKNLFIGSHRKMIKQSREGFKGVKNEQQYQFSSAIDTLLLNLSNQIVALDLSKEFEFILIKNCYQFNFEKILNVLADLAAPETNMNYLENNLFKHNFYDKEWQAQFNRIKTRYRT